MVNARRRQDWVSEMGRQMPVGTGFAKRRRKSLRDHFCDGLRAGLKAEPQAFAATKPRTMMGLMVRNLVCAAADARCDAVKLVFSFVDEAELRTEAGTEDASDTSQGISGPESGETQWDWDETSGWDSSERETRPRESKAEDTAKTEALREELHDRFMRMAQGIKDNALREARLEIEQGRQPTHAPFSGNSGT
ncbi:MAG TPA: hypothetical protein VHU23_02525 [Rhizomicrobium sp.]|jgi:hypothetical protein|nr:hypothetical protein [Rhizomicrobium sp.]